MNGRQYDDKRRSAYGTLQYDIMEEFNIDFSQFCDACVVCELVTTLATVPCRRRR